MSVRVVIRVTAAATIAALLAAIAVVNPDREAIAAQSADALPLDLALVPCDALGFVHVRAAELWKSDVFARFRATYEKADPKARESLDTQFVPKPTTFDRATVFFLMGENEKFRGRKEPAPYGILRFSAPFEVAEIVTTYLPKATAERVDGKTIYRSDVALFELYFPDHQHIVISPAGMMVPYLKREAPKTGPLSTGLKLAASRRPVVASINLPALPIPQEVVTGFSPDAAPLLKADHVTVSLDLSFAVRIDLLAGYKTADEAVAAERAVKALAQVGRKELAKLKVEIEKKLFDPKLKTPRPPQELPETLMMIWALGGIAEADELLANPEAIVKRAGNNLTVKVVLPKDLMVSVSGLATGAGLLLPAVQKVRMAAARAQSQNNLKQIALACINYSDANGHLPQNITDKNGKPLLSWRVAILPFIEQQNLYNQFKLDEPWDSEHNKPWSQMIIKTYMSPQADPQPPPGMTFYKGFAGPGTVFEPGKQIRFPADIPDGTSNTILVAEVGPAVPWAKPEDIPFDPKKPLPKLALPGVEGLINVAMCDGSTRLINVKGITPKTLSNAITRDDGNPLGSDW